jgi:hypothetical protein
VGPNTTIVVTGTPIIGGYVVEQDETLGGAALGGAVALEVKQKLGEKTAVSVAGSATQSYIDDRATTLAVQAAIHRELNKTNSLSVGVRQDFIKGRDPEIFASWHFGRRKAAVIEPPALPVTQEPAQPPAQQPAQQPVLPPAVRGLW